MKQLLGIALLTLSTAASAQKEGEQLVYGFRTKDGGNLQLIRDTLRQTLSFYLKTGKGTQLEVNDDLHDPIVVFTYSYYFRGGGKQNAGLDLNCIIFKKDQLIYKIYDEYSAETEKIFFGLTVTDQTNGNVTSIEGVPGSRLGSLAGFRVNNELPVTLDYGW